MYITGKMPCKYGPIFGPYLHDWTLYTIRYKYSAKTGPYLHGVFPVHIDKRAVYKLHTHNS